MLHQPISNDRALNQSFYQTLINHFIDHLNSTTQTLVADCRIGIAPNAAGVKTFFLIASDAATADQLIQQKSHILHQMHSLMVGIGQLAICIEPQQNPTEQAQYSSCIESQSDHSLPQYMMCQIFQLPEVS
ncbi:MAG: hypothetical protein WBA13_02505 [Microcoleaceae cyanobacterium]